MSIRPRLEINGLALLPALLFIWPTLANAQVPVDDDGKPIGEYSAASADSATGNEEIPLLTATELADLVGPIALYPDDLLAIVLPAAAYPLQIVQAGRFLEALENDPELQPDESWDDSVVALINYPEVVRLLNDDLDWTWRLGEAVVAQQADVIAAVETFRDRAYAAGNLKSDDHQTISRDEGYIEITPVDDDVIYVPYYEPERVVVYQPRPVYYYYPEPCPVYYYPYPSSYAFQRGFFWGVTTAFTVGWHSDRLHVFHHSYRGHPYYGRHYWPRWGYRQPTINVYNNIYVNRYSNRSRNNYRSGDYWQPRDRRTVRSSDKRVTRTRHYPGNDADTRSRTRTETRSENRSRPNRSTFARREDARNDIRFRERPSVSSGTPSRSQPADRPSRDRRESSDRDQRDARRAETRRDIKFRDRSKLTARAEDRTRSADRRTPIRPDTSDRAVRDTRPVERRESRDTRSRRSNASDSRQSQIRHTKSRKSDARRTEVKRHEARRSEPRQSQRRQSESKPKKSGSVKLAENSRKERTRNRDHRR